MRRLLLTLMSSLVAVIVLGGPAGAQVTSLDAAASALRSTPVYVDAAADRAKDVDQARVIALIRRGDTPIFVAVLPASAVADAGGDVNRLPAVVADRVGLRGTYAVVAGSSFRAGSNVLPTGLAGTLATASFQAKSANGVGAVLDEFISRVNKAAQGASGASDGNAGTGTGTGSNGSGSGVLLLLLAGGGGAAFLWSRSRNRRRAQDDRKALEADRQMLHAELSVLGNDVIELEPDVTTHPDARPDYDAGVTRYQSAQAALDYADEGVDLVRVERVIDEGRYAMARARAHIDSRPPPPPPEKLTRPGRRDEPALQLDERGAPVYVGQGDTRWYGGGGWFGGGSGLLTGLMLGQMFGGGWGGGWGGGYYGGGDGGNDGGGDDAGGGDWGGGGDFGGGDFGGGGDF